jgi:hypothetical protein
MRCTRNAVYGKPYRGFESHPLRQEAVLHILQPARFPLQIRGFWHHLPKDLPRHSVAFQFCAGALPGHQSLQLEAPSANRSAVQECQGEAEGFKAFRYSESLPVRNAVWLQELAAQVPFRRQGAPDCIWALSRSFAAPSTRVEGRCPSRAARGARSSRGVQAQGCQAQGRGRRSADVPVGCIALARASKPQWKPVHADDVLRGLTRDVFPVIGKLAVDEVKAPKIREMLKAVQREGAIETAHRLRQRISAIF